MRTPHIEEPSGRETRLLLLVVAVALAVLLLLARFRFPESQISTVSPSVAPLAGLAARATYEEMAETMSGTLGRVAPAVAVIRLESPPPHTDGRGARGRRGAPPAVLQPRPRGRFVTVVRLRSNLGLVSIPEGVVPAAVPGLDTSVELVTVDPVRRLGLVRLGGRQTGDALASPLRVFAGFAYLALVDATATGATVRPVFVGRADPITDSRWPQGLTTLGDAAGLPEGSVLFTIGGRFVGIVVESEAGLAIVPVPAIEALVSALEGGDGGRQ